MEGFSGSSSQDEHDPAVPRDYAQSPEPPASPPPPNVDAEGFQWPPNSPTPTESSAVRKEKGRVRFNSRAGDATSLPPPSITLAPASDHQRESSSPITRPRPSVLRGNSSQSLPTARDLEASNSDNEPNSEESMALARARERAKNVAAKVRRDSGSASARLSFESAAVSEGEASIPLQDLTQTGESSRAAQDTEEPPHQNQDEAWKLVRSHTQRFGPKSATPSFQKKDMDEETIVPSEVNDGSYDGVYNVPAPKQYRGSVLAQLLKLYNKPAELLGSNNGGMTGNASSGLLSAQPKQRSGSFGGSSTPGTGSGTATPVTPGKRKWYEQNRSQDTLANLIEASTRLANPAVPKADQKGGDKGKPKRPAMHKRAGSATRITQLWQKEEARITVHIAETLSRQEYLIKLCRALMLFGAPTHRLEEYLSMSARILEIDGQFLYLPGCMIISFDDRSTHTTEVKIVRTAQGIDLGKLKDVHHIYKEVMHDCIGVEEGTRRLMDLMSARDKFSPWLRVFIFGLTSATAGPFSFKARLIDLPICFCFGALVGALQLIVTPHSNLYSNVFEVSATVLVSFLARAFGSIAGGSIFCFSAISQSGIVMLLPGYSVLCSSLELQSRALVPGSIRIVYAIIYSLLLGFGITVGASIYGLIDGSATSETQCHDVLPEYYGFIFVPLFVVCISILYQAKWRQMPVMLFIACSGYIVNYFSGKRFSVAPQIANTLGAFTVGVLANLYSRLRHGVAAATLIPAIFTQVPGGLASTGGLLSGLKTANAINNKSENGTSTEITSDVINSVVFDVAASMIQIAIGIAVGLFMSALVVYPLGKRRSGLFSF
ncbi:hypothetical protein N3K66_005408 [Trichothecium roseum]|uniref:Uncharacterized protein n=1 Tax=Trichothecium roseum TaxID=47278 RepID=A0ACC0UZG9_9HYPO|nr:hypothetical protein N3K66_005408 [Trichothecium roseum]